MLLGLINGSFYAMLSLGLAVIFGLMNVVNFTHGAQYMLGAFVAWLLLNHLGIGYWPSLVSGARGGGASPAWSWSGCCFGRCRASTTSTGCSPPTPSP